MTKIAKEIAELADLGAPELQKRWQRIYRADPPVWLSRDLLIRASRNPLCSAKSGPHRNTKVFRDRQL